MSGEDRRRGARRRPGRRPCTEHHGELGSPQRGEHRRGPRRRTRPRLRAGSATFSPSRRHGRAGGRHGRAPAPGSGGARSTAASGSAHSTRSKDGDLHAPRIEARGAEEKGDRGRAATPTGRAKAGASRNPADVCPEDHEPDRRRAQPGRWAASLRAGSALQSLRGRGPPDEDGQERATTPFDVLDPQLRLVSDATNKKWIVKETMNSCQSVSACSRHMPAVRLDCEPESASE